MQKLMLLIPLVISGPTFSEVASENKDKDSYKFNPVLLDSNDNSGALLGIEYGYNHKWTYMKSAPKSKGNASGWINTVEQLSEKNGFIEFKIDGIWTNDHEINPKSYSKTNIEMGYEILKPDDINTSANDERDFDFGLHFGIEGDQNYDNNQTFFAAQAGAMFGDSTKEYIAAIISYGEVDASSNKERMSLTSVDKFDRFNAEIQILYPLSFRPGRKYSPKSISLNYRYFHEIDAPQEIEDAELDKYKFGVIRIKFENGLFIGYGKGKLPFDFDSKSVLEIGISQNLF